MSEAPPRIGDVEREQLVATLSRHVGLGHLTIDEFEGRLDKAYAARTRDELAAVAADLPTPARAAPKARPAVTKLPVAKLPAAWVPLVAVGAISMVIWLVTSLAQGHPLYFWPIWVVLPWGLALLTGPCRRAGSR